MRYKSSFEAGWAHWSIIALFVLSYLHPDIYRRFSRAQWCWYSTDWVNLGGRILCVMAVNSCLVMTRLYWLVWSLSVPFLFVRHRYGSLQCIKRRLRAVAAFVQWSSIYWIQIFSVISDVKKNMWDIIFRNGHKQCTRARTISGKDPKLYGCQTRASQSWYGDLVPNGTRNNHFCFLAMLSLHLISFVTGILIFLIKLNY